MIIPVIGLIVEMFIVMLALERPGIGGARNARKYCDVKQKLIADLHL